jgi:hypothetical protein
MEGFDFFSGKVIKGSCLGIRIKELFIILGIIGVSDFSACKKAQNGTFTGFDRAAKAP